jgi:hypothetical protein
LAALLQPRDGVWQHDGVGLVSPEWRAPAPRFLDHVVVRAPTRADAALEVGLGPVARYRLRLAAEGATGAAAHVDGGRIVYPDAYPSTDVIVASRRDLLEVFLLLHDASAPTEFSWSVTLPSGIVGARRDPTGGLVFVDAADDGVLRVADPFAVDARGRRHEATLAYADQRLRISLDRGALAYPVLLDPTVANVVWEQKSTTGPNARFGHAMVYDAARAEVVLFGGDSGGNETWAWKNGSWTLKATTGPSARAEHAMAYDSARQVTVLFGGSGSSGGNGYGDYSTWEWNGTAWASRSPLHHPTGRTKHAMAYDAARGRTVLFGGVGWGAPFDLWLCDASADDETRYGDTWTWDGTDWSNVATSGPPARGGHVLFYMPTRQQTVLAGGYVPSSGALDTWEWDGNSWTQRAGTTSRRFEAAGAAHTTYDHGFLVGGEGSGVGNWVELYTWSGSSWSVLYQYGGWPPARERHAIAFDSGRRRLVLFGGRDDCASSYSESLLGDTWEMHLRGYACTSGSQCDSGYCVDGVCCEVSACPGTCVSCATGGGVCAAVENAVDPDTCTGDLICSATSQCLPKNGMSCTDGAQCASSFCVDLTCCAEVCGPCRRCDAAGSLGTCSVVAGAEDPDTCRGSLTCNSLGSCVGKQGSSCSADAGCLSEHCVDGVCCAVAACGTCEACNVAGSLGTCVGVANVTDPDSCPGACDASGACKATRGQACATSADCLSDPCVDGVCCATASCGTCQACNLAGSLGTCSAVVSAEDPDTCAVTQACNPVGACKKKQGQPCVAGECLSGFCVDGVCCDSACTGTCQACAAAKKQTGADGFCGDTLAGIDPHGDCTDEGAATCGLDGTCNGAGGCRKYPYGQACGAVTCVGNTQSGFACNGLGACLANVDYDCGSYRCVGNACRTSCADASDCTASAWCNGTACEAKRGLGAPCPGPAACQTGFCVDGVCCDSACSGLCQACSSAAKGGGLDGACGFAAAGSDPRDSCPDDGAPTCDRDGTCDGQGQCALYPADTECGQPLCDGDAVTIRRCNGSGTCATRQVDCGPYACVAGACLGACTVDADCASGEGYCDVALGECSPRQSIGTACLRAAECLSGFCVDGVCCTGACPGQCEACDVPTTRGTCTPVDGPPHGSRSACPAGAADQPCTARTCVASGSATTCAGWVGAEVECRPGSCQLGVETPAAFCDGAGQCDLTEARSCGVYACGEAGCKTSCGADSDCADAVGFRCDSAIGSCVPREGALCDGHIVTSPTGARSDCTPYACVTRPTGGACRSDCAVTTDCAPGFVCDSLQGNGVCVAAGAGGNAGGGCSMDSGANAKPLGLLGLVLGATVALLARRRQRPRRHGGM